jgi:hypothetical protein
MALISKHKSVPNQSTQYLTLTETTGVFGTLNPGGYGAGQTPAGLREIGDILTSNYSILNYNGTLTYTGSTTPVITEELYSTNYNNTNAQLIAGGTTQSFDLATLIGVNYVDAVYKSIYYNWFTGTDIINQGDAPNILAVPDYNEFTNAKYVKIDITGLGDFEIYEVLQVNTNDTIVINENIQLVSDHAYQIAYESTAYFANTYNINKCLHFKISQLSLSTCSCKTKSTEKLYEAVMMYMSIQPNMDLGKYTKAQEIIQALTIYCNGGECNC